MANTSIDPFQSFSVQSVQQIIGNRYALKIKLPIAPDIPIGYQFTACHGVVEEEGIFILMRALGRRRNDDIWFEDWYDVCEFTRLFVKTQDARP